MPRGVLQTVASLLACPGSGTWWQESGAWRARHSPTLHETLCQVRLAPLTLLLQRQHRAAFDRLIEELRYGAIAVNGAPIILRRAASAAGGAARWRGAAPALTCQAACLPPPVASA